MSKKFSDLLIDVSPEALERIDILTKQLLQEEMKSDRHEETQEDKED